MPPASYQASASSAPPGIGIPVAKVMPTAPPMSALRDDYSHRAGEGSSEHTHPADEHDLSSKGGTGRFWSEQEMQTLQGVPVPPDPFQPVKGQKPSGQLEIPMAVAVEGDEPQTGAYLTSGAGVPIQPRVSRAAAEYNGYKGIKSCDPLLDNTDEILCFLQTHNSRPRVMVDVWGHHQERRHRRVRRTRQNGDREEEYWEDETYYETVTDFRYKVDLTQFVFPYGYIQSSSNAGESVPDLIQKYIDDGSQFKRLEMRKMIGFDFDGLRRLVRGYIRSQGWFRDLTVSFPQANYKVRLWQESCMTNTWDDGCGKCLCYLSVVGCLFMNCMQSAHETTGVKSYFQIQYDPLQVRRFRAFLLRCLSSLKCGVPRCRCSR